MKILLIDPLEIIDDKIKNAGSEITVYSAFGFKSLEIQMKLVFPQIVCLFSKNGSATKAIEYAAYINSQKLFRHVRLIYIGHIHQDSENIDLFDQNIEVFNVLAITREKVIEVIKAIAAHVRQVPNPLADVIQVMPEKMTVRILKKETALLKKEFMLFQLLHANPDRVISRKEIFEFVWQNKSTKSDRTIDVHISNLRKKLGLQNIVSLRNQGFKFRSQPFGPEH